MQYRSVTVLAPAKLNLSLDVVGTLPNGYHDLDMVMQTIDLYEKITLRRSNDLSLTLPGSFVPVNDKNTAVKAALAFFDYTGLLAGVDMTIYKRVPVRAGMAGGSADAAGVLVGLNELYGAHLSMSELCAIGAGIGADVPFALLGGTCRVRGVGDLMKALPPCPDCRFVVAMPSVGVSTPEAFARYDTMGSPVHPDCEAQEQAIRDCNLAGVCAAGGNALEHCSGAVETPAICKTLREHGAVMAQMTGSGAAVFGIFDDENDKINLSLDDVGGELLVVSQFTLYGNCRKGRHPEFLSAARPEIAIPMYEKFVEICREKGYHVETGEFGAYMEVESLNDGPFTLIVDSADLDAPKKQ
jgi:4-diphosphocytidyl-2-C-methyl-D-erythritol kinase